MKKGIASHQNTFLDTIATRFDGTHSNFVLGNAQGSSCPVVYCSDGFCELTGYPRSQVMGRSCACKFLFGADTLPDEKEKIDEALENKTELKTELQFYKKDGESFKCLLDIVPIKNEKSQVVLILVSHKDIGDKPKSEDNSDKSSSDDDANSSDEEMAEAYRRCQQRRGRSSGALPSGAPSSTGGGGYNNQRRRSRAVLYHLSGQFDKHKPANRAKSKLQQFNKLGSISAKMPEYKVQEVKKSKFILVHYGIFKIGWDWLILLCTFYTAILVPFNAAFNHTEKKDQRDSIYSDVVVEILFMFDILFNFRTSFVNKRGQVVYQAKLIAINYIRGWFLLDLLAAIPFDFLYIFRIKSDAPVHLLKVARLLRLARLLQKIDRFSQYSALVLALLIIMFTLIAHWLACVWYAIGHVEFESHETAGWLYELSQRLDLHVEVHYNSSDHNASQVVHAMVKPDVLMSYVSALYFTCTSLTSVGFGNVSANTNSEKIFSIIAMIIGALMHAVVFGNVTALIQRMYARRANFHSKTKELKDFFRTYDIPKPLKQRMQEYFQTMWSMNNGIEATEILKDFPEEMKGELMLYLHKDILNLTIFEDATQGCLKSIALHTRRSFCAPGEFLVHKGDAANYLNLHKDILNLTIFEDATQGCLKSIALILKDFPEEMKGELMLHLHKDILNLTIFEDATQGCLKSIALHTRRSFCAPGEFLVHKGDAANYLYLLVSGSMEVLESDMVVAILGKGDLFGAHIDFEDPISVCNYDVRSLTYSELQCISIKGLVDVLLLYPDFAERFAKDIHNDLTYNLRQTSDDSDEESKGSPKGGRLFTLPSISEDDELSASDEEQDSSGAGGGAGGRAAAADTLDEEDEDSPTSGQPSSCSPLLPQLPQPLSPPLRIPPLPSTPPLPVFAKPLPNGDLNAFDSLTNSPNARTWGMRRGGANMNINMTRNSIKDTRKMRLGCHQNDPALEKVIPHIQNLQNDIEGTKASIGKLEKKVSKIGQDISAIDRNMREILKHITLTTKMSPLEPIYPTTPNTPFSVGSHFNFDQDDSRDNLRIEEESSQRNANDSKDSLVDTRRVSRDTGKPFIGELPLPLNPHDQLSRRHSDGPVATTKASAGGVIPTAKSDYSIRNTFMQNGPCDTRIPLPLCDSDIIRSMESSASSDDQLNMNTSSEKLTDSGQDLLNGLEEIHSHSCFQPDRRRRSETITTLQGKLHPCDRKVRKSITCGNFNTIPTFKIEISDSVVTERSVSPPKDLVFSTNNENSFIKEVVDNSPSIETTYRTGHPPPKSSSCYEMKSSQYVPMQPVLEPRSKSFDVLMTEFGAAPPNDIRVKPMQVSPVSAAPGVSNAIRPDCVISDHSDRARTKHDTMPYFDHVVYTPDNNRQFTPNGPYPETSNLEQVKYDSGNVSLLDNIDCYGDSSNNSDHSSAVFKRQHNPLDDLNVLDNVQFKGKGGLIDRNKSVYSDSIEVSPDSVSDLTESLQTESTRTDDETAVDIETGQDVIRMLQNIEEGRLRSTDL